MKLSEDDVLHVARLARLMLNRTEVARFTKELSAILAYMDMLGEVDAADREPTSHVQPLSNALRADIAFPPLPLDDVLVNAPSVHDGAFEVPRIIDED